MSMIGSDGWSDGVWATAWSLSPLAGLLPDGLPTGAVTCLVLPERKGDVRSEAWSSLIGHLLLAPLDRGQPVIFTSANRLRGWAPEHGWAPFGPRYFGFWDSPLPEPCCDASRQAYGGPGPDEPATLDWVTGALDEHEPAFGPALVVVDDISAARPYVRWHAAATSGESVTIPAVDDALVRSIAEQRAADLLAWARARPDAPTVVSWHRHPSGDADADPVGEAAVRAVSQMVLDATVSTANTAAVLATVRSDESESFSVPVRSVIPRLNWGFHTDEDDGSDWGSDDEYDHGETAAA